MDILKTCNGNALCLLVSRASSCAQWTFGEGYRQVLSDHSLPWTAQFLGPSQLAWLFQEVSATPHRCQIVRGFQEASGNRGIDWPTRSTHLNPIEHLWDELEQRERQHGPTSIARLASSGKKGKPFLNNSSGVTSSACLKEFAKLYWLVVDTSLINFFVWINCTIIFRNCSFICEYRKWHDKAFLSNRFRTCPSESYVQAAICSEIGWFQLSHFLSKSIDRMFKISSADCKK